MAISRDKKQTLVKELGQLVTDAKAVAVATYTGLGVKDFQSFRALARENNLTVKVVKNRLVKVVLKDDKRFKEANLDDFKGQLLYVFSNEDEVLPAQILAKFAKEHPEIQLVAGWSADGAVQDQATVTALASLPTKDQLKGQLVGVLAAPLRNMMLVMNGAQAGFARVLSQKAEQN